MLPARFTILSVLAAALLAGQAYAAGAQFSNGMYDLHNGNPYPSGFLPDKTRRLYAPRTAKQNAV